MTLAIEPMVNMGKYKINVKEDGWTVVTDDGKPFNPFIPEIMNRLKMYLFIN